jgi:chromosome segregation ATPase
MSDARKVRSFGDAWRIICLAPFAGRIFLSSFSMTNDQSPATKGDMTRLNGRMDEVSDRVGTVESRMSTLDSRMDSLDNRMDRLEQKVDALDRKLDDNVALLRHELALAVETLRDVFVTAHREQIEILKQKDRELEHRVERLEQATGLAA